MTNADQHGSGPQSGSAAASGNGAHTIAAPKSTNAKGPLTHSREDILAAYFQAVEQSHENSRKREEAEKAKSGQQTGQASSPLALGAVLTSASLQDGGPVAPDNSQMMTFFADVERSAEEQRQSVRERDQREADGRNARIREEDGQTTAHAKAMETRAVFAGIADANAALFAGFQEHESNEKRGAGQHGRDQDAGWREFGRNQDAGWREFCQTEASGARQQQSEERRRNSGMSL